MSYSRWGSYSGVFKPEIVQSGLMNDTVDLVVS